MSLLVVEQGPPQHGMTAVVNRHGALLLSPVPCEEGTLLWIRNELSSETVRSRVTWTGSADASGAYKLGVEFLDTAPKFWGELYEEEVKAHRL